MLVLSRKPEQCIVIGGPDNPITITVVEICGNKVRLGVDADKGIPVYRQEVYDAIQAGIPAKPKAVTA